MPTKADLELELTNTKRLLADKVEAVQMLRMELQDAQRPDDEKLKDYKKLVRDRVIEEAIDRDWCDEVNDFLESIDLEPRTHAYTVTVPIHIDAPDSDAALSKVRALLDNVVVVEGYGNVPTDPTAPYIRDYDVDVEEV